MLLIGFSEIGEDVDNLACGGPFNCHLMCPIPDENVIKKLGGLVVYPRKIIDIFYCKWCILNQFGPTTKSSPATYFSHRECFI